MKFRTDRTVVETNVFAVTNRAGEVIAVKFDRREAEAFARSMNFHYSGTDKAVHVTEGKATIELPGVLTDQLAAVLREVGDCAELSDELATLPYCA